MGDPTDELLYLRKTDVQVILQIDDGFQPHRYPQQTFGDASRRALFRRDAAVCR